MIGILIGLAIVGVLYVGYSLGVAWWLSRFPDA